MADIKTPYKTVLSIAGSDSGGCAGIQADIKSISACGAYAATVVTATTAQNTQGVIDIHPIPVLHIEKQLEAVFSDINFGAVKIGMLHSCEVIETVARALDAYGARNVVIDPVMVATSGDRLIANDAIACLKRLLPKSLVVTPNKVEAELLLGYAITANNAIASAEEISRLFQTSVLLKAGCLDVSSDEVQDVLYDYVKKEGLVVRNKKTHTKNTHGTGCSLSSSLATFLSQGKSLKDAVFQSCAYVNRAIRQGQNKRLGEGKGPINHFGF